MNESSLSIAFGDSLKSESISCIGDLTEVGLDAIMEDGIFKDIPIISTAISVYKIGNSILERHNLKKLAIFLSEINNDIATEQKRIKYQQKFQSNDKFRNKELEYLLVLINRYIDYEKPKMLAKIYLAYLDGKIGWNDVTAYSTIIDTLLPEDISFLLLESPHVTHYNKIDSSILRLVSMGLLIQTNSNSIAQKNNRGGFAVTSSSMMQIQTQEKIFGKTDFGKELSDILNGTE